MSREIKFRIYDKKRKSYIGDENGFTLQSLVLAPCDGVVDKIEDYVFERDTGLKDMHGRRIWDGDIVNVIGTGIAQVIDSPSGEWMLYYRQEPDEINSGFVSVVPKNKPSGLWKTNATSYIEVIGNIHEDKELLRGGK